MTAFQISGIIGEQPNTAGDVSAHLLANPDQATLVVNSPGGDAFEGAAILAEIQRHGSVAINIQGMCASAASLLAMGGAEIVMHPSAMFMIHDPSGFTMGTATDHRGTAETLDKLSDVYAKAYADATGNSFELIKAWMHEETWLTAEEALALNFIDRIEGAGADSIAIAQFNYTKFKAAPDHLIRMVKDYGWASDTSKHEQKRSGKHAA